MKKLNKNVLLPLLVSLVIIALGEFVAGHFIENSLISNAVSDWRNKYPEPTSCFKLSDTLGFEPIWGQCGYPDLSAYAQNPSDRVLGEKTEKTQYRVLILGDSNTNRANVDDLLEEKLNTNEGDSDKRFEVIKIGVESYNTWQEYLLLKNEAIELSPDIVILQFSLNDFDFSPVVLREGNKIVFFTSKGEKNLNTNSLLFKYSSLYRIISLNKLLIEEKNISEEELHNRYWEEKVEAMGKNLKLYNQLIEDNGISSVVVIYPIFDDVQWEREKAAILEILRKNGIEYIDLLPLTSSYGGPKYFQSTDESGKADLLHPVRAFDDIVAEALRVYIDNWSTIQDSGKEN